MDTDFKKNQVTLTIGDKTYSSEFVARAVEFALQHGLSDQRIEKLQKEFSLAIHTPVGPVTSRPVTETGNYLGFWTDWLVDGEFIALSTSEYQVEEDVFVTHDYADFSEDSPSRSTTHYFDKRETTDANRILQLLRPAD